MKPINITPEQMTQVLEKCYDAALTGVPGSKPCEELATEYLQKYRNPQIAARKLIDQQILKCSASGFITNIGGLITLPVALPANIASVLYVQLRMIASIAYMGGYDLKSDEVQTLIYLCLIGTSIADACKSTGVSIANKTTRSLLNKVPASFLKSINHKVGFRMVTRAGTKGAINLVSLVPIAGGLVGAGIDFVSTRKIANKAFNAFLLNDLD